MDNKEAIRLLLKARIELLARHGFFGVLLMKADLGLTRDCPTAYTDGKGIYVNPGFLSGFTVEETMVVLLHELLHLILNHCQRGRDYEPRRYNIAADIVVNSLILYCLDMDFKQGLIIGKYTKEPISLIHQTPKGKEGYAYTAEQVYAMLDSKPEDGSSFDDHSHWGEAKGETPLDGNAILQAAEQFRKQIGSEHQRLPIAILNALESLSRIDWRTLLHEFLDFEIDDYSFLPPDRRFVESDFFLPDWNEAVERIQGVAVLIDASGSISDEELGDFFQELLAIIDSFQGRIEFYAGLFDVELSGLIKITGADDIKNIKGEGRGGTSLEKPLEQLFAQLKDVEMKAIVVLTDGYLDFLSPKAFHSLPVLWVINNLDQTPTHGKIARLIRN